MSYNKFQVNDLKIQDFTHKTEFAKNEYLHHIQDTTPQKGRQIWCKESLDGQYCNARLYLSQTAVALNDDGSPRKLVLKTLPSSEPHADFCVNKAEAEKPKAKPRPKKEKVYDDAFFFGKGKKNMDNDPVCSHRILYSVWRESPQGLKKNNAYEVLEPNVNYLVHTKLKEDDSHNLWKMKIAPVKYLAVHEISDKQQDSIFKIIPTEVGAKFYSSLYMDKIAGHYTEGYDYYNPSVEGSEPEPGSPVDFVMTETVGELLRMVSADETLGELSLEVILFNFKRNPFFKTIVSTAVLGHVPMALKDHKNRYYVIDPKDRKTVKNQFKKIKEYFS